MSEEYVQFHKYYVFKKKLLVRENVKKKGKVG